MNNDITTTAVEIVNTLQEARGELSVFENKFPTDSIEHQLIVELLERLDDASDEDEVRDSLRDDPEAYGVDCETIFVADLREGDIILSMGEPFEVKRLDGWWLPEDENGPERYEKEITGSGYNREDETFVLNHNRTLTIDLRND